MCLVPSEVNVRSANPILPVKVQNPNAFNLSFCCWVLSGSALKDHERCALLCATDAETRQLRLLSPTHTTNGTSPPNMAADLHRAAQYGRRPTCIGVSAAAAAACMSAGGRVWWWAVSRSRTPTTRCRAGAYATGITPGVYVRALDVRGRGCAGDGLLQRRDDRRKRTHERKAGPAEGQRSVG